MLLIGLFQDLLRGRVPLLQQRDQVLHVERLRLQLGDDVSQLGHLAVFVLDLDEQLVHLVLVLRHEGLGGQHALLQDDAGLVEVLLGAL